MFPDRRERLHGLKPAQPRAALSGSRGSRDQRRGRHPSDQGALPQAARRGIDHTYKIKLRQTEIASFKFPLKLTAVTQVDSKASPAVQLADIIIGAALEAGNALTGLRAGGLDPEALLSLFAEDHFIHLIPSIDFEAQRQFRQGAQASAVIDYFAASFGGKR